MFKPVAVVFAALLLGCASDVAAQTVHKKIATHKSVPCRDGCKPATSAPTVLTTSADDAGANQELSELARNLHNAGPGAYAKLSAFAGKHATDEWGARAALALGYDDYQKNRGAQALAWLTKAKNDALLQEYVLFWSAQAKRSLKRNAEALADLSAMHRDYPNTAIREQLLDLLAVTATESGHAQDAIEALNGYNLTISKPTLLLDRAHAYQVAGQTVRAAKDYQTIFYKYPLSDEGKVSGASLVALQKSLRSEFPYATAEMQEQRAQALFEAHKWRDAKPEFEKLVGMLHEATNPVRQRAQLRLAQCKVQLKASLTQVSSLVTPDPDVDAERLFVLSQFQRTAKKDDAMLATIEDLGKKYPQSKWTEEGYMQAGNYYWVALDRAKAVANYQRVLDVNPSGKNSYNAEWRIAWIA
jgi:tetratricopeptide (TPR) repeat protein